MKLSVVEIERINYWVAFFRSEYEGEIPMRIHAKTGGSDEGGGLGGPPFHPEFIRWMTASMDKSENKWHTRGPGGNRMTKVLRQIRSVAPREYFVLQLIVTYHMSIAQAAKAMNQREQERGSDLSYSHDAVTALLIAGIDKAQKWY